MATTRARKSTYDPYGVSEGSPSDDGFTGEPRAGQVASAGETIGASSHGPSGTYDDLGRVTGVVVPA